MHQRNITPAVMEALADTPVVFINGARQTGKSTLVGWLAAGPHRARYLTLDDPAVLAAAESDPSGFIAGLDTPVALDEVQRAPKLFYAIKASVDRDRRPGRFLLTGSADVLMLPGLAQTLTGRVEILTLWPLSQGELAGVKEGFIDAQFAGSSPTASPRSSGDHDPLAAAVRGGFPEIIDRRSSARRKAWFRSYLTTILQREVRDIANIEDLTAMPRILSMLAARTASLLNVSELSRSLGIPAATLRRYLALLEATFLMQPLPAWSGNLGKRLVKAPKIFLCDTGLTAHLLGFGEDGPGEESWKGPLLEAFVVMELRKQCEWSETRPSMFHFRAHTGQETDVLLEGLGGQLVGIEVKATRSVTARDFKGLRNLSEQLGKRFMRGVVIYTGDEVIPFGERLYALPVRALWETGAARVAAQSIGRRRRK